MQRVAIVSAARTPVGALEGGLASLPAHELGATALYGALARAGVEASAVDETIMGQVLTAGQGQNPARQAHILAGLPVEASAWGINQICGSGLRAVMLGAQQILLGDAQVVLAGGQENMSLAPHVAPLRRGKKMGNLEFVDSMLEDGLTDAFKGYLMGVTAETIAERWGISRSEQDEFALASHQKAEAAQKAGLFAEEIVPVVLHGRKGEVSVSQDEHLRHSLTLEALSKLRPSFKADGTVTAGNSSGLNDGAAAVLLMSEEAAKARGLQPLAYIASAATAGVPPEIMGIGPVAASRKALSKAGWSVDDLDLIEANEAFAAQAIAVARDMHWPAERVNVNGGAIALGHPIGASGARVLTTLLYEMRRRQAKRGLATLCIGGGMGVALCLERD